MSGRLNISRRQFGVGALLSGLFAKAYAQGFAGLGVDASGFAQVTPGRTFVFPADHGAHPEFRIEWWYVTANLTDAAGTAYGAQWTLFRQAMRASEQSMGWANPQAWMAHAAVTRADTHRFAEKFARGGIGQAGVTVTPFHAWIDSWTMLGLEGMDDIKLAPLRIEAAANDFSYSLQLDTTQKLVMQGDKGFSRKSDRSQASYYFSQPFYKAAGRIVLDGKAVDVTGSAWLDREWSSQPLAADQTGWDWLALHLNTGEKLMLFRLRQTDGATFISGNWILADGHTRQLASSDVTITPTEWTAIGTRKLPTGWRISIPSLAFQIEGAALNPQSWMGTSFPYWEGPVRFGGSHAGLGYLEMTGY